MSVHDQLEPAVLSEVESLSDSDWLDIASGRESEDTDSIRDESDADPEQPSRSRRSSISAPDTPDVDRWEGFIDDAPDVERADSPQPACASPPPMPTPAREPTSPLARNVLATEEDLVEDERVRHALDQSMISTLSSSRSSTYSHVGSELRLSFPDPITSSRDDLHQSFEAMAPPSEVADTAPPSDIDDTEGVATDATAFSLPSTPSTDQGSFSAPEVQQVRDEKPNMPAPLVDEEKDVAPITKPVRDHITPVHVATILGLLSLALGYMMSGSVPSASITAPSLRPPPVASPSTIPVLPVANVSETVSSGDNDIAGASTVSLVVSSIGDFALSVISTPSTAALAVRPSTETSLMPVASGSGTSDVALTSWGCPFASSSKSVGHDSVQPSPSASTSLSVIHPSNSLVVLATTTTALNVHEPPMTHLAVDVKGKGKATAPPAMTSALSKHLSTALDVNLRALGAVVYAEVHDLVHALDELTRALVGAAGVHAQHAHSAARTAAAHARELRDGLHHELRTKHGRAKERARRLKSAGQRWIAGVAEGARARVRSRTDLARRNARALRSDELPHGKPRDERREARRDRRELKKTVRRAVRAEKQGGWKMANAVQAVMDRGM